MKNIFLLFVFLLFTIPAFSKGSSGIYYIAGIAKGKDKAVLRNTELQVKIGNTITLVTTDEKGHYEITVPWHSACPSMITKQQYEERNKKLNPEKIYVTYSGMQVEIENNWQKYRSSFSSRQKKPKKLDLHFA